MPTTISIKNAPDALVDALKQRARRHHRSLQGELLAILEDVVGSGAPLGPAEVKARVEAIGLRTPRESVRIVRAARDGR